MNSNSNITAMSSDRIRDIEYMSKLIGMNIKKIELLQKEPSKENKNWDVWTDETCHEPKDSNKWYFILDNDGASRYKGEWVGGLANGQGVKEIYGDNKFDHSIIEGTFVDGMIHGKGKQTYDITREDEECAPYYEGEFKEGKQHGFGAYYYGNGCYLKGNVVEDMFQGLGIYYCKKLNKTWVGIYIDNERTKGQWNNGEIKM